MGSEPMEDDLWLRPGCCSSPLEPQQLWMPEVSPLQAAHAAGSAQHGTYVVARTAPATVLHHICTTRAGETWSNRSSMVMHICALTCTFAEAPR